MGGWLAQEASRDCHPRRYSRHYLLCGGRGSRKGELVGNVRICVRLSVYFFVWRDEKSRMGDWVWSDME